MLRLSKKVEYAIIALQYLASKQNELVTAKEIAEQLDVPFEFLSKSLQTLMKKGIIDSLQGIKGGYQLTREVDSITINEVILALDEKSSIVECFHNNSEINCNRADICTIKHPMAQIQKQINMIFKNTTLAQLSDEKNILTEK